MNLREIETEITKLTNELEDIKENMIYLLTHQDIRDINLLNFHFEVQKILNQIDYLEKIKFNMKF